MHTVTVAANKGGTGKTTTAVTLASRFALDGHRVLLIDLDGQGHAAAALGYKIPVDGQTTANVLKGETTLLDAIVQARPNLWLLPADDRIAEAEIALNTRPARGIKTLARSLRQVEHRFDLVFIDTPPASALSAITQNGLFAADSVVCPVQAKPLAVRTLPELHRTLLDLRDELDWGGRFALIVPTFVDERRTADSMALHTIMRFCGQRYMDMVKGYICENTALATASANGQTIWESDPSATGAKAYAQLSNQLSMIVGGRG